jgi:RNA polymerase sigma-70 factor (ECF subfamily)
VNSCGLGQPVNQCEEIVQDILLAVHRKRHTWHIDAPVAPCLFAIARNKLIDALRKRGKRVFVNIDDLAGTLSGEVDEAPPPASEVQVQVHLRSLPARQREVLQSIAVESTSIRDTATEFSISEGAVRVALHRGLARLTVKLRES